MQTSLKFVGGILLVGLAANLHAQETPDPLCVQAEKIAIPQIDMPTAGTTSLDHCDPLDLQSFSGHLVDLRQARYCAYAARDAKSTENVDMDLENIGGNAGLAMIYAGGKGVAPNLPLAIRFACEIQGGWDDGTDVAKMLEEKRKQGAVKVDFDICEGATGRQLNYICLLRDQDRVANEIDLAEEHLNAGNSHLRPAFQRVAEARKAFLEASQVGSPRTTGQVQSAMRDDIDTDHQWAQLLEKYAAGALPQFSKGDFQKADVALNTAYRQARVKTAACHDEFCFSADQLVQMERAWIAYRDAWVAYATTRWPSVSTDSWRTWLTLEQTEDLKNIED
jgi:uncharacterized protein YecT (DUF1311 family)